MSRSYLQLNKYSDEKLIAVYIINQKLKKLYYNERDCSQLYLVNKTGTHLCFSENSTGTPLKEVCKPVKIN